MAALSHRQDESHTWEKASSKFEVDDLCLATYLRRSAFSAKHDSEFSAYSHRRRLHAKQTLICLHGGVARAARSFSPLALQSQQIITFTRISKLLP